MSVDLPLKIRFRIVIQLLPQELGYEHQIMREILLANIAPGKS